VSHVLVIAPHPDDETLGCGGTLLRHRAEGDVLFWCIATEMSGLPEAKPARIRAREKEIAAVARAFGFRRVFRLGHPAAGLDQVSKRVLTAGMAEVVQAVRPDVVYLPHAGDVHSDHGAVFDAAWSACKPFRAPFVRSIRAMEIPSETGFAASRPNRNFYPNFYLNISRHLPAKLRLLRLWKGESGKFPFPRSLQAVKALAQWRGSQAGFRAAEAFQILRETH
jgi:LmbE family N-acetylglucosaminyl deacetylase